MAIMYHTHNCYWTVLCELCLELCSLTSPPQCVVSWRLGCCNQLPADHYLWLICKQRPSIWATKQVPWPCLRGVMSLMFSLLSYNKLHRSHGFTQDLRYTP